MDDIATENRKKIVELFNRNVRGKKLKYKSSTHHGSSGHSLEEAMHISRNSRNEPDILGYEMKDATGSKTSFGDWSADFYIYKDKSLGFSRNDFLQTFGTPNVDKPGRFSWSGSVVPTVKGVNQYGQELVIDEKLNISVVYSYSKDKRADKHKIVPSAFQMDNLVIVRWSAEKLSQKVENKFGVHGWFKCLKDKSGVYREIVFGGPIHYPEFIQFVREGKVILDSGMYTDIFKAKPNIRPYQQWRASNAVWNSWVIDRY